MKTLSQTLSVQEEMIKNSQDLKKELIETHETIIKKKEVKSLSALKIGLMGRKNLLRRVLGIRKKYFLEERKTLETSFHL